MHEKTIIRPAQPEYSINEIVYSKIAATKGYIEPLKIASVEFDQSANNYRYAFWRDHRTNISNPTTLDLMPITLLETEIVDLCDALDLQISSLSAEYTDMETKFQEICGGEESTQPDTILPVPDRTKVKPPAPRFGIREVVYLKDTATTVGRLESYRVDNIIWDSSNRMWIYYFSIRPRPTRNTTVGDRDDMRRSKTIIYPESQLCTAYEAISLAVSFLRRALTAAQLRKASYCENGSGSDG